MRKPSARVTKWTTALATPVAVLVAGGMIWQASYAAFSGQTRNSGNEWSTGSVALSDDDSGSARFSVTKMVPGDTDTECIKVTANASVPGEVRGYAVNPKIDDQDLARAIKFTVNSGTGGSFASCEGFTPQGDPLMTDVSLQNLSTFNDYESGMGGWAVAEGTQSRTYQITWELDTEGLTQAQIDSLQGDVVGVDLQWELQSTEKS